MVMGLVLATGHLFILLGHLLTPPDFATSACVTWWIMTLAIGPSIFYTRGGTLPFATYYDTRSLLVFVSRSDTSSSMYVTLNARVRSILWQHSAEVAGVDPWLLATWSVYLNIDFFLCGEKEERKKRKPSKQNRATLTPPSNRTRRAAVHQITGEFIRSSKHKELEYQDFWRTLIS